MSTTALGALGAQSRPLPDRAAGRRMLMLLVGVLLLPFALAAVLIGTGWRPAAAPHYGELVASPSPLRLEDLTIRQGPEKSALTGRWLLVAVEPEPCTMACLQRLDMLRRVHVALYKAMPRVHRLLLLPEGGAAAIPQPDLSIATANAWPALASAAPRFWLVDPHGLAVLRYDGAAADFAPKLMLKDIERLLRYSWSG